MQIAKLNTIKENLLLKQFEYDRKLEKNYNEVAEFQPIIEELDEQFSKSRERIVENNQDDSDMKRKLKKLHRNIILLKKEIIAEEDVSKYLSLINTGEKSIKNIIPDMTEEQAEHDILISKTGLRHSLSIESKTLDLPVISSPANSMKNHERNPSISALPDSEIDRILQTDYSKLEYVKMSHTDFSSLLRDEKILKIANKETLRKIEGSDYHFEKETEDMIDHIMKKKESLNYLKKENDSLSLEVKELANILRKFESGELKPPEREMSPFKWTKDREGMNNSKKNFKVKRERSSGKSKDLNSQYKMRDKYMKELRYQRIFENKIY